MQSDSRRGSSNADTCAASSSEEDEADGCSEAEECDKELASDPRRSLCSTVLAFDSRRITEAGPEVKLEPDVPRTSCKSTDSSTCRAG